MREAIYDKSIANIIANGEQLKPFLIKPEIRQGYPPTSLLFNIIFEFLSIVSGGQEKKH
jgi:hypothetical protein